MAVAPLAARRAYGISGTQSNQNIVKSDLGQTQSIGPDTADLNTLTYKKKVAVDAESQKAPAQSSDAATTVFSKPSSDSAQGPQKQEEVRVSSILAGGDDVESYVPPREGVEKDARRYLKIAAGPNGKPPTDEEVKKLADFYAASPDRAARFSQLVNDMEQGQETPAPSGASPVAVA